MRRNNSFASFGIGSSTSTQPLSTSNPLCTCNAESLKEELRQFRISSAEAVKSSWTEVETLQTTCTECGQKIDDFTREIQCKTAQLEDSLAHCNNLEEELDTLTKINADEPSPPSSPLMGSCLQSVTEGLMFSAGSTHHPDDKDNVHDHGFLVRQDQERQDQENRTNEFKRLKQILVSRNLTVDNMEYVLAQNVKMMQNFQMMVHEIEEKANN